MIDMVIFLKINYILLRYLSGTEFDENIVLLFKCPGIFYSF